MLLIVCAMNFVLLEILEDQMSEFVPKLKRVGLQYRLLTLYLAGGSATY